MASLFVALGASAAGATSAASALGTIASIGGTVISALGQIQAGKMAAYQGEQEKVNREHAAKQMEIDADLLVAEGQHKAKQHKRQKDLALSELQNKSAASGFDPLSGNTDEIDTNIREWGEYQAAAAMANAQAQGQRRKEGATMERISGDAAAKAGKFQKQASYGEAAGTLFGGMARVSRFGSTGQSRSYSGVMTGDYT